jgi:hypothetical protein
VSDPSATLSGPLARAALRAGIAWICLLAASSASADGVKEGEGALPPPRVRVVTRGTPPPAPRVPTPAGGAASPVPEDALVRVPERPERPTGARAPGPEDLVFEVERPGGVIKRYPQEGGGAAYVMIGNPRLAGQAHRRRDGQQVDALRIQAATVVAWVDERALPEFKSFGVGTEGEAPKEEPEKRATPPWMALFEEAVEGIYAEGAVEVVYGELVFRAEALYLEPRTFKGLLLEPMFQGRVVGRGVDPVGMPAFTQARRARLVAKGLMVFDDAEVSSSRADDRIVLRVRQLEVEQQAQEERRLDGAESPSFLGFQTVATQRYRARDVRLRAERVPIAYLPYASFGLERRDPFPMTLKRLETGNRSSLGLFAFVGIGGSIGPEAEPWADWLLDLGGYTKRGAAAGLELSWDRDQSVGKASTWGVFFDQGEDRTGFVPDRDAVRGRVVVENRTFLTDELLFDAEFNTFSDRGFNREYFEKDEFTHKDRESYLRLLWRRPELAATLTGKWHQRDFVTETVEAPEAGFWVGSVPILAPGARGGLGIDLVSQNRAGWLERRFDDAVAATDYAALRVDTDTRLAAGLTLGDVRLSGFTGVAATGYGERDDGGEDLVRTALLAGARANVQLHRVYGAAGGFFALDGLRHVLDVDGWAAGRFLDSANADEVPYFDEREEVEQRTEVGVKLRQRFQTRRAKGGAPRDVVDLDTAFRYYVDDVAPYLQREPWSLDWTLRGELKPDARLLVGTQGVVFGDGGLFSMTAGVGVQPVERVSVALAYRYLQGEAAAPLLQAAWRWSEKYELRASESYNIRDESNDLRVVLRRFSADHVWSFGVRMRDADDFSLVLDFRPAFGGAVGRGGNFFENEIDLDPIGAFR